MLNIVKQFITAWPIPCWLWTIFIHHTIHVTIHSVSKDYCYIDNYYTAPIWFSLPMSILKKRQAKNFVSQEVLVTMYNSLVLPHFNYCSTIWHDDNIENVLKLQKRAARVITSSDYSIRSHQIFKTLHWQPIKKYWINENYSSVSCLVVPDKSTICENLYFDLHKCTMFA